MSALLAPLEQTRATGAPQAERPVLHQVPVRTLRLSRVGFIALVTLVLGAGMVLILLLNTHIQQRAQVVAATQRTADDLGYRQASLTARVEQLRSSSDLATRAWEMGLRPNPHPAFVKLDADGRSGVVLGEPTRVTGQEMPEQKYVGADEVTRRIQKSRADYTAKQARQQAEARARAEAARKAAERKAAERKAAAARATAAVQKAAATKQSSTGGR